MKAHKLSPGSAASLILEALAHKPRATQGGLRWMTLKEQNLVAASLSHLVEKKRVVIVGTMMQARAAGVEVTESPENRHHRHDAKVYALPGTPMLPEITHLTPRAPRPTRSCSSGIPAGRRTIPAYRWFVS